MSEQTVYSIILNDILWHLDNYCSGSIYESGDIESLLHVYKFYSCPWQVEELYEKYPKLLEVKEVKEMK